MSLDYELLRSWLFVPAADQAALHQAARSGADVAIAEFEDFTPPDARPRARAMLQDALEAWRSAGIVPAVRINPLRTEDGPADLDAALDAGAQVIAFPKTQGPDDVRAVAARVAAHSNGAAVDLLPNIESAAALVQTVAIAQATDRVKACLVASEDMAADLQAVRSPEGAELRYVRERFLVDCRAAGVVPVDCPYTWTDDNGLVRECSYARQLGYTAKSAVQADQARLINEAMTPSAREIDHARKIVAAFDDARARGLDRALLDGHAIEAPTRSNAARLLERADKLRARQAKGPAATIPSRPGDNGR